MTRLLVYAEGQTEEAFVRDVLAPHLYYLGYTRVDARMMGNAPQRNRRGGVRPWPEARVDILNHLRADADIIITTMVDYYGMPSNGAGAWPGRPGATAQLQFPNDIENSLFADVSQCMGHDTARFIPYVMMHEFEAMLFSDCVGFAHGIGDSNLAPLFQNIRDGFTSPEDIDDSPATAPSKRIGKLVPRYRKPVQGIQAAVAMGLERIRTECWHFRQWLERLEDLVS